VSTIRYCYSFSRLAKLISLLRERTARDALLRLLRSLRAHKDMPARASRLLEIFEGLEAWSKHRINEPDVTVRLEAYDMLQKVSRNMAMKILE